MRIALMKAKHWAHEWPADYVRTVRKRKPHQRFKCDAGHSNCAPEPEAPCVDRIENDNLTD